MTDQEFQVKIDEETQNIKELGELKVPYNPELGRWHEDNRAFEIHQVNIRDAYWRRRMLIAKIENLDESETAQVY